MYTTARLSVLLGAGLLTAALGAGPAQAAGSGTPAPPPPHGHNNDTVGYFMTRSDCEWIGWIGDLQNRWDNPGCNDVNYGPHRGMWQLTAQRRDVGSNGWPGLPHGPGMPGWPGMPGHPGHPGGHG
jgi:hypothetical protein